MSTAKIMTHIRVSAHLLGLLLAASIGTHATPLPSLSLPYCFTAGGGIAGSRPVALVSTTTTTS